MGSNKQNLDAAFAGESQANRKYLFFAEKAEQEGHPQIARLFRAVAEAETVHARTHFRIAGGIKTTRENLLTAIQGEKHEFSEMYPAFVKQAEAEGERQSKVSFEQIGRVEEVHHGLYQAAAEMLDRGEPIEGKPLFVCQVCGYTTEEGAPERCPICGAPERMFKGVV